MDPDDELLYMWTGILCVGLFITLIDPFVMGLSALRHFAGILAVLGAGAIFGFITGEMV
jgi:hypothetical protein